MICVTVPFYQHFHLRMSGFPLSCASACPSSAPSSTAKCAEKSPRTNCAATRGNLQEEEEKKLINVRNFSSVYCIDRNVKTCAEELLNLSFDVLQPSRASSLEPKAVAESVELCSVIPGKNTLLPLQIAA